jgi:hypothetical protein
MKQLVFLFGFLFGACSAQELDLEKSADYALWKHPISIPLGGNTFTSDQDHQNKISKQGITSWRDSKNVWDVFIYVAQPGNFLVSLDGNASEPSVLSVSINGQNKLVEISPEVFGDQKVGLFDFETGYNKISIQGVSGQVNYPNLEEIRLHTQQPITSYFVRDNIDNRFYWGRRGPSVHLSFTPPDQTDIVYYYTELTVPSGADIVGSYFMANGFAQGYFGIQVNSPVERRVLFSVWSPYQTDDPNQIPEQYRIKLIAKGPGVYTGMFGNEGSGGQSYLVFPWKSGTKYSFLSSAHPDGQGNTVFAAYFRESTGPWQLIASFLRPMTDTWYTNPHAFLENFEDHQGYLSREVNYNTPWVFTTDQRWIPLTQAKFTTDDIGRRQYRLDFAGGIRDNRFFLKNGGFFNGNILPGTFFDLPVNNQAPSIDFESLPK